MFFNTTEQHKDARDTRVQRDRSDVQKFVEWFAGHDPFPPGENVISISSGVVGDRTINCHKAFEVGTASMAAIVGNNFADVHFLRRNRVMPIRGFTTKIKIHDIEVPVNPDTLFRWIIILKKSDAQLKQYFQYELAPYPLSLFEDIEMRKTKKSVFYDLFSPVVIMWTRIMLPIL